MRFNGCFNREPFKDSMIVQDGAYLDGYTSSPRLKSSPFRMAKDCQYTLTELGKVDPQCAGCKWKHKEVKHE